MQPPAAPTLDDLAAALPVAIRWPVDRVRVTPHGAHLYDRSTWKPGRGVHLGVDLYGKRGTPVLAPEDGEVVAVWLDDKTRPWRGYGPAGLCIRGDSGIYHVIAHLIASAARAPATLASGDRVRLGDVVGYVSGYQHVHWEPRRALTWGRGETHRDIVLDPFTVPTIPPAAAAPAQLEPASKPRSSAGMLALVAVVALAWWAR